jgi:hypothetical protein
VTRQVEQWERSDRVAQCPGEGPILLCADGDQACTKLGGGAAGDLGEVLRRPTLGHPPSSEIEDQTRTRDVFKDLSGPDPVLFG